MIVARLFAASVLAAAVPCVAAETTSCKSFTKRQCAEIEAMVAAQRAAIFAELGIPDPALASQSRTSAQVAEPTSVNADVATAPQQQTPPQIAQSPPANDDSAKAQRGEKSAEFFDGAGGSVLDRADGDAQGSFQLTGSTENNRAALRYGMIESGPLGRFNTLSFSVSAPFDKNKQKYANIATLDGLANAFQFGVNYALFVSNDLRRPFDEKGGFTAAYQSLCRDAGLEKDCTRTAMHERFLAKGLTDKIRELDAQFEDPAAWRRSYGVSASVGHDAFDYFLPTTLAAESMTRKPWSVAAQFAFLPPPSTGESRRQWYFAGGLEYQRTYAPAKVRTFCPVTDSADAFECTTGNFGPPVKKDKRLVSFEARTKVMGSGVSLKITRDFRNDETGVDMPIYLVGDGAGALNGGLRLGWTNTDKFSFGVFVGSSFDIFPN